MRINKRWLKSDKIENDGYANSKDYVDMRFVPESLAISITIVFFAFIVICCTVPFARHMLRKPGPPPKVITKVVHESALSAAQREYIKQCENQDQHPNDSEDEPGIPDVHNSTWKCTYAK